MCIMKRLNGIEIARAATCGGEAYRILWYLTDALEFETFQVVNVGEISTDLGLKSQAVSRALRALIDGGVLERGPRTGRRVSFRFSRQVARPPRARASTQAHAAMARL
jgi:DNA-binding MarR family transcriptional regulator